MKVEDVQKIFNESLASADATVDQFPWESFEAYSSWIGQTYEYVQYVTRILSLTAGRFPLEKTLHSNRFVQHSAEEKGHDRLLINDAKALGIDLAKQPLLPEAEGFHKSLYFWIYQDCPTVILGWALFLEGFAVRNGPKIFSRVEKAHGAKAASFLRVHSNEDPDHVEKAFELIKKFPSEDLPYVAKGLKLYSRLYTNIYRAIEEQVKSHRGQKAA